MKLGVWTLIFALILGTIDASLWPSLAFAVTTSSTSTAVTTFTQTDTSYETITSTTTSVSTNIAVSQEPGNQLNSQQNNQDNNKKGSDQSSGLGMAAIAAGMAMVAAGMAMMNNPATQAQGMALVMAGMALIASGMAALAAADKMDQNAGQSGQNAGNMSTITGGTSPTPISLNTSPKTTKIGESAINNGGTGGIKIDPALTRSGKIDGILSKMEQQTGISREALADGLNNGMSPVDMLAHAPSLNGNKSASLDNLNKAFDAAQANGLPNANDVMDQLGLSPEDVGGVGTYDLAGGGAGRNPAATSPSANFDGVFGAKDDAGGGTVNTGGKLSGDVQAQLDSRGLPGGRTIFDMVHAQYRKKTPMLWGAPSRRMMNTGDNPFGGLTGERIDLSGP